MSAGAVNLARRPFANTRPIRRVAWALWGLGAVLATVAGVAYWRSLFGIEGRRAEIAGVERSITAERRRLAAAENTLASFDLRHQNVEASYVAERLRERTFPWSELFEHLGDVLPRRVRLFSLSPTAEGADATAATRNRRTAVTASGRVFLQMTGSAATDEDLTKLLDNLFASGWFANPTLPTERRENGGITFVLKVSYLPAGPGRAAATPAAAAPAPRVVAGDGATAHPSGAPPTGGVP